MFLQHEQAEIFLSKGIGQLDTPNPVIHHPMIVYQFGRFDLCVGVSYRWDEEAKNLCLRLLIILIGKAKDDVLVREVFPKKYGKLQLHLP